MAGSGFVGDRYGSLPEPPLTSSPSTAGGMSGLLLSWTGATALGMAVGWPAGLAVAQSVSPSGSLPVSGGVILGAVIGLVIGAAQWIALRKHLAVEMHGPLLVLGSILGFGAVFWLVRFVPITGGPLGVAVAVAAHGFFLGLAVGG